MSAAEPAHERAFELLPWLVNGTLAPAEREAVEQHVRSCIVCRRELKEQRQLHAAVRSQPTVPLTARTGLQDLERELDRSPDGHSQNAQWSRRYAALRPFAVAAAAGIALLAFLLWLTPLPQMDAEGYSTLATPSERAGLIDVVFEQQTTAAEIAALLAAVDGEIVAGPSAVGRYTVRVAGEHIDAASVNQAVGELAQDRRVRFAGRSLAELPP